MAGALAPTGAVGVDDRIGSGAGGPHVTAAPPGHFAALVAGGARQRGRWRFLFGHTVRISPASMGRRLAVTALMFATACSRDDGGEVAPAPRVDDRRPIPRPDPAPAAEAVAGGAAVATGAVTRKLLPAAGGRAAGVDALDEAIDSAWFTNRNGVRPLSPASIRRGPGPHPAPRDGARWSIVGMKQTGVAIGMRARDERGDEFFLKFDPRGHDEVETGADVAVQRLLFAAGYNVPENDVVYLAREALSIAPGTTIADDDGERPLRDTDVDRLLDGAAREPDGRYRALASRHLPGAPLGGIEPSGRRPGDTNDRIAHQDRRDMRGLYSLAAWLNHTDIKPKNTLEVWIPERDDPSRGHVVHYLLDFGKALGAMGRIDRRPEVGFAHEDDPDLTATGTTLGRPPPPWHGIGPFPDLRGLGWLESERFDPARWKAFVPWLPFQAADRFDRFWGARIVMSFTPAQIRAALAAARYTEPRTVEYLLRVLVERQRKVGAAFFREVAPLERARVERRQLCVDDLWVRHRLGGDEASYTAEARTGEGEAPWTRTARAGATGTVCFGDLPEPQGDQPITVDVRIARPGHDLPATEVRIAAADGGALRVVALERR